MRLARPVAPLRSLLYHAFVHLGSIEHPFDTSETSVPAEQSEDSFVYLCITKVMIVWWTRKTSTLIFIAKREFDSFAFLFRFLDSFCV